MINSIFQYFEKIKQFNQEAKLFLMTIFIAQFLNGGYQVIFNLYLDTLGYNSSFIGSVASIRLIVGALLGIPLGILATKLGYKKSLLIVGLITSFSLFGITTIQSKTTVILFSILWGIGLILRGILNAPFLSKYSNPEERSHLFGLAFSLQTLAAMLGNFLGGSISSTFQNHFSYTTSYQYTLIFFTLISILSLIPIFLMKPESNKVKNDGQTSLKKVIKIAKTSEIRSFILYSILIGTGAGLIVPLFNIFLRLRLNSSDFQIGTLLSLTQIATSLGCLLTPYLINLFGKSRAVVLCQLVSIPFLIIVGGVSYFPIVAIAYFFRSSLMNMVNPIIASASMEITNERDQPAVSSLIRTFRTLGRGSGVYLSGIFLAGENYLMPFILTCILYFSGSLIFYFTLKSNPKMKADNAQTTSLFS